MRPARLHLIALSAAITLALIVALACGGDDDDGGGNATETPGVTPTPFALGSILVIRGQEVELPLGVIYFNQSPECQQEDTATTPECADDYRILQRGESYILFESTTPRVIARRIEPADEDDFRPLLGLISGTSSGSTPAPAPTQ